MGGTGDKQEKIDHNCFCGNISNFLSINCNIMIIVMMIMLMLIVAIIVLVVNCCSLKPEASITHIFNVSCFAFVLCIVLCTVEKDESICIFVKLFFLGDARRDINLYIFNQTCL